MHVAYQVNMNDPHFLFTLWNQLFPEDNADLLRSFLAEINTEYRSPDLHNADADWYKDAVVYSLYVDLFNKDIPGLISKLDYLQNLGVTCLWLLPVLESPMRDAGFDISDYYSIRSELAGEGNLDRLSGFRKLLKEAHKRNIKVIFDVAMNHTSDQHPWFLEACKSTENQYHNYYIWTKDTNRYAGARIIFKGIETSNWERCGDNWFFHRFFNFQPDLNYRNPQVLLEMSKVLLFWQQQGVDGFRADAVPYIWKEEGTSCENLPKTHTVVKFFRAILDFVKPGSLLLAEACQQPVKVVEYLGQGDECHAAYHFPLMPRMFMAIAQQSGKIIRETLSPDFTPVIPKSAQWFTFLRCHDELSLEKVYVTEEERAYIHQQYCHEPLWDFRMGEGISARLSELFNRDAASILLAYSIMLTLPGTPVIYYGDEIAKLNDMGYYLEMIRLTGKDDTRFLGRGRIDWVEQEKLLQDPSSLSYQVFYGLHNMLRIRFKYPVFGRGTIEFIRLDGDNDDRLLSYLRRYKDMEILVIQNLGNQSIAFELPDNYKNSYDLLSSGSDKLLTAKSVQWRINP